MRGSNAQKQSNWPEEASRPEAEQGNADVLYTFFEHHLYEFEDESADRRAFVETVVEDYLAFLSQGGVQVPPYLRRAVVDELGTQVNTMLVKKIYGCSTVKDFRDQVAESPKERRRKLIAKRRYKKLVSGSESK